MRGGEKPIEPLALRRATIVDRDKIRYRVYRAPNDFVAVIAENALMAMRIADITKPYKILRDLPASQLELASERIERTQEDVSLALAPQEMGELFAHMPSPEEVAAQVEGFTPLSIGELQREETRRSSIIPPEMIQDIISEHQLHGPAPSPPAAPEPSAPAPAPPPPTPTLTPAKLLQMADEILPPPQAEATGDAVARALQDGVLTPEEVEKLLNE